MADEAVAPERTGKHANARKEWKPIVLSEPERQELSGLMKTLCQMRADRDQPHPELDGMTYVEYYDSNRKKDLAYLPPKKNKQDVRISSGVTREKDTTLLSTLLNMNFAADITAFDTDDLVVAELGDNMSDLVKKSREIEMWHEKKSVIYREMISQGDVFVLELKVDEFKEMPLEEITWNPAKNKVADFSYASALKKLYSGCEARMVTGKKVYLGNIREPFIRNQPVVAVLNVYPWSKGEARYRTWERFQHVPEVIETTEAFDIDGITYKSWNLVNLQDKQMAEIMVFDHARNRFQILLNGVPMLPHNYPLTALSATGQIPMSQGKFEPISDFAYSKSQPSKTKVDEEVLNETTKLMIEGMRQGRKPPMGTRRKKAIGSDIFIAGKVTPDIKEGDLFPILEKGSFGLNQSDFSFYQLIKQGIEEKSVNKAYEGDTKDIDTLGQAQQDKEQQMLKLGLALDGAVNLERDLTWHRLYNILQNWTLPMDQTLDPVRKELVSRYRNISVETTLDNGEPGMKQFRFAGKSEFPDPQAQYEEEQKLKKTQGQEVRVVYMDPEALRTIKYTWYVVINPTPKSDDKLSQILFIDNVQKAIELFGPEALNMDYLKQRFAIKINEDYSKFFLKQNILELLQKGMDDPSVANETTGSTERRQPVKGTMSMRPKARIVPARR